MRKMEAPRCRGAAASGTVYAGKLERPDDTPKPRRLQRSPYRRRDGRESVCGYLVRRAILKAGGLVRS